MNKFLKAKKLRQEADKLSELQVSKDIESLENSIKEDAALIQEKREKLKALKVQKTTEKKNLRSES